MPLLTFFLTAGPVSGGVLPELGARPIGLIKRGTTELTTSIVLIRKLGETIVASFTVVDADGVRQSMEGVTNLRVNIKDGDGNVVVDDDPSAYIDEIDNDSVGDIKLVRPDDGKLKVQQTYAIEFAATISGMPVKIPESFYVYLVIV